MKQYRWDPADQKSALLTVPALIRGLVNKLNISQQWTLVAKGVYCQICKRAAACQGKWAFTSPYFDTCKTASGSTVASCGLPSTRNTLTYQSKSREGHQDDGMLEHMIHREKLRELALFSLKKGWLRAGVCLCLGEGWREDRASLFYYRGWMRGNRQTETTEVMISLKQRMRLVKWDTSHRSLDRRGSYLLKVNLGQLWLTLTQKDGPDTLPQGPFNPILLQDSLHGTQHFWQKQTFLSDSAGNMHVYVCMLLKWVCIWFFFCLVGFNNFLQHYLPSFSWNFSYLMMSMAW